MTVSAIMTFWCSWSGFPDSYRVEPPKILTSVSPGASSTATTEWLHLGNIQSGKGICKYSVTNTVVSRVCTHGHLNINCDLSPHAWALTWDITSIHLYRSYYIDPLKCSTWALTLEWYLPGILRYMYLMVFHQYVILYSWHEQGCTCIYTIQCKEWGIDLI